MMKYRSAGSRKILRVSCLGFLLGFAALSVHAVDLPPGGTDRVVGEWTDLVRFGNRGDPEATVEVVDIQHMPFDRAVRVSTTRRPESPWQVTLHATTHGAVRKGDILLLSFWMRSREGAPGTVNAFWEMASAPHEKLAGSPFEAGTSWLHCVAPAEAPRTLDSGTHQIAIHLGFEAQTVEIGGLRAINYQHAVALHALPYMHQTYEGRNPDAAWRVAAHQRIQQIRTGNLRIRVVDSGGQGIEDANVSVSMRRHEFGFGSAIHPGTFARQDEDGRTYREVFRSAFNKATTESGFRWQNWIRGSETQRTQRRRELEQTLGVLQQESIKVRGHYLMWAPVDSRNKPPDLLDQPNALRQALWTHAEEKARWAGTRVDEWDAVNHIVGWGTRMADLCRGNQVYADLIRDGRTWAPHATMWVNEGQVLVGEGSRLDAYRTMVTDLVDHGAAPDGVGFMGHFKAGDLPSPTEILRRLDSFASFGCMLQLTELDVECGSDEQLQADYLRDVITLAFSHPRIHSIVLWGFWEGQHWIPSAALWRRDWSIKPAGKVWMDLVKNQWWTDTEGTTDVHGRFATQGFAGEYEITVQSGASTLRQAFSLSSPGKDITVMVPTQGMTPLRTEARK